MGFGEELNPETPEIDVHGYSVVEALREAELFIDRLFMARERAGRIITGKGSAILSRELPKLLQKHPLLTRVSPSNLPGEIGAVLYVVLKR